MQWICGVVLLLVCGGNYAMEYRRADIVFQTLPSMPTTLIHTIMQYASKYVPHNRCIRCTTFAGESPVYVTRLVHTGKTFITGNSDGTLTVYDAQSGAVLKTIDTHGPYHWDDTPVGNSCDWTCKKSVGALTSTNDGSVIISARDFDHIKIWGGDSHSNVAYLKEQYSPMPTSFVMMDEITLVAGYAWGAVRTWDITTQKLLQAMQSSSQSSICSLARLTKNSFVASNYSDGLYSLDTRTRGSMLHIGRISGGGHIIQVASVNEYEIALMQRGNMSWVHYFGAADAEVSWERAEYDDAVLLYGTRMWQKSGELTHKQRLSSMVMLGKRLLSVSDSGLLELWNVAKRQSIEVYNDHESQKDTRCVQLAASPCASRFISCVDKPIPTIRMWQESGK